MIPGNRFNSWTWSDLLSSPCFAGGCAGLGASMGRRSKLIQRVSTTYGSYVRRHCKFLFWIESPIDEKDGDRPHLCCHTDATPVELFFGLFFVANLSTFTATHEINNIEGAAG